MSYNDYPIYNKETSVWINASAGTGKTKRLIDRVLALIIQGCQNIICITFTNAAVEEIISRVNFKLRNLLSLSEDSLLQDIQYVLPDPYNYPLKENLLSGHDKFKVYTIHGLCAEMLGSLNIIDETDSKYLFFLAFNKVIAKIQSFDLELSYASLKDVIYIMIKNWRKFEYMTNSKDINDRLLENIHGSLMSHINNDSKIEMSEEYKKCSYDELKAIFLCKDGSPRKLQKPSEPQLNMQRWVLRKFELEKIQFSYEATKLLLNFARDVYFIYNALKCGKSDYNDLIYNVIECDLEIIRRFDYKIDHLLIDEAQDNSPEQWILIDKIISDFFDGDGARELIRTIFVVGDVKQSIYGFCGVDPKFFNKMHFYLKNKVESAQQLWHEVDLNISFRSNKNILYFIDCVFEDIYKLCTYEDKKISHISRKNGGEVYVYDIKNYQEKSTTWKIKDNSLDVEQFGLANDIAKIIKSMIESKKGNTSIKPDDIMILVRKRTDFIRCISVALTDANVPFVCSGKILLKDHTPIKILIAIGRFIVDYECELGASLLSKSPVFEDKPNIAHDLLRWSQISGTAIDVYISVIDDLYEHIHNVFGADVGILMEKFMILVSKRPWSLREFITWIDLEEDLSVTNNNIPEGVVKIMTIHGSKGLESDVVFIVDDGNIPKASQNLIFDESNCPFYVRGGNVPKYCKDIKQKNKNAQYSEYIRLLYVALTRARNQLHIFGCKNGNSSLRNWYQICAEKYNQSFLNIV